MAKLISGSRDLSNLCEFNLKEGRNVNILVGVLHKDKMTFKNESGQTVNIDEHYLVQRITNSSNGTGTCGFVCKEIKVGIEDFKEIFIDEVNFMKEWAFCPVMLELDTDDKDKKLVLYGCSKSTRFSKK